MWVNSGDHYSCDTPFLIVQKNYDLNFHYWGLDYTPGVQMLNRAEDKLEAQPEKKMATRWVF